MNHRIEFDGTKQVRCQLDNQTPATIKWDVATVRVPIASVRRLTMQGNKVVFEEQQYVEHRDGYRTELVVQSDVYRLRAQVLDGRIDSKLLRAVEGFQMRALVDQAEFHAAVEHPRTADADRGSLDKVQGST